MTVLDLWVNGFDNARTGWTRVGTSPYLNAQDQPTNYVYTTTKKAEIGDFSFTDSGKTTETINSVTLYLYANCNSPAMTVYIWDGTIWQNTNISISAVWGWYTANVSSYLDTWSKIDGAKIYFVAANSTVRQDADAAYLSIDYTGAILIEVIDALGLTDGLARDRQFGITDSLGLTDTTLRNKALIISDSIGLTDSAKVDKMLFIADQLGLTEAILGDKLYILLESLGLTDTISMSKLYEIIDSLGLAEELTVEKIFQIVDSLGLIETISISKFLQIVESIGLTDSISIDRLKTVLDSMGITESIDISKLKSIVDVIGLTEQVDVITEILIEVLDSMGITDEISISRLKEITDIIGLTETIVRDRALIVLDEIGITEEVELITGAIVHQIGDSLGISEIIRIYKITPIPILELGIGSRSILLSIDIRNISLGIETRRIDLEVIG